MGKLGRGPLTSTRLALRFLLSWRSADMKGSTLLKRSLSSSDRARTWTLSSAPTPPKGTTTAPKRAATRTKSVRSGHRTLYSSPGPCRASRMPPGKSNVISPFCRSLKMLRGVTGTAPKVSKVLSPPPFETRLMASAFAKPLATTPRSRRNSRTRGPKSRPKIWWFPTRRTGRPPRSAGVGTPARPKLRLDGAPSSQLQKMGENTEASRSTTSDPFSTSARVGKAKSATTSLGRW
mmetsp:Transcript_92873/g.277107  ORF Transcript_92873/g.277107 Transcript_92873/m.277107 type:complete len:235 (+) Transcript_92873:412-1116(+)